MTKDNISFTIRSVLLAGLIITGGTLIAADAEARGGPGQRHSFEELDANGDGQLTEAEMLAHRTARFSAADSNGDGQLSADELTAAAQGRLADRVEQMISHRDANNDGLLSAEEMGPPEGREGRLFARFDENDDGMISAEEFEAAKERMGRRHGRRQGHDAEASE